MANVFLMLGAPGSWNSWIYEPQRVRDRIGVWGLGSLGEIGVHTASQFLRRRWALNVHGGRGTLWGLRLLAPKRAVGLGS